MQQGLLLRLIKSVSNVLLEHFEPVPYQVLLYAIFFPLSLPSTDLIGFPRGAYIRGADFGLLRFHVE